MSVRSILTARFRKRILFAVLRPKNQQRVPGFLDSLPSKVESGMTGEQFSLYAHELLGDEAIFVGYLKRGSRTLFDYDGKPIGAMQPGDVLDKIEDFRRALDSGAYTPSEADLCRAPSTPHA